MRKLVAGNAGHIFKRPGPGRGGPLQKLKASQDVNEAELQPRDVVSFGLSREGDRDAGRDVLEAPASGVRIEVKEEKLVVFQS